MVDMLSVCFESEADHPVVCSKGWFSLATEAEENLTL